MSRISPRWTLPQAIEWVRTRDWQEAVHWTWWDVKASLAPFAEARPPDQPTIPDAWALLHEALEEGMIIATDLQGDPVPATFWDAKGRIAYAFDIHARVQRDDVIGLLGGGGAPAERKKEVASQDAPPAKPFEPAGAAVGSDMIASDSAFSAFDGDFSTSDFANPGNKVPVLVRWMLWRWPHGSATPGRSQILEMHRSIFGQIRGVSEKPIRLAIQEVWPSRSGGAPSHRKYREDAP